jgi:hypothetical protein
MTVPPGFGALVQSIVDMGFARIDAIEALVMHGSDMGNALSYLTDPRIRENDLAAYIGDLTAGGRLCRLCRRRVKGRCSGGCGHCQPSPDPHCPNHSP